MTFDFSNSLNEKFSKSVIPVPTYPLDDAVSWIQENLSPYEVFTEDQLTEWARSNGFVEEG